MAVTFTNDTATPVGLWDTDAEHHVVAPYGGTATLEPDQLSQSVIDVYVAAGAGAIAAASAPVNTVAPVVSGTETVGQTLTATNGTWTGSPTITYTYQWQNSVDGEGSWLDIAGADEATYLLDAADEGLYVRCVVTATNSQGAGSAESNVTGAIAGAE